VFGEIGAELYELFSQEVDTILVENLEQAVMESKKLARHGDAILFSPGTSSFDQFSSYIHPQITNKP